MSVPRKLDFSMKFTDNVLSLNSGGKSLATSSLQKTAMSVLISVCRCDTDRHIWEENFSGGIASTRSAYGYVLRHFLNYYLCGKNQPTVGGAIPGGPGLYKKAKASQ